jgi:alpha-ribazole phosphatase
MSGVWVWRHPKPHGAAGRCIGRTDLPLDHRRAKRLAHRIRVHARRHRLPREVWTSPLQRCRDVGRWLRAFGFIHRIDVDLLELDFGRWDGRSWTQIDAREIAAWTDDFVRHPPGGGEPLQALLMRAQRFVQHRSGLAVSHAGWINAALWQQDRGVVEPTAAAWPAPLRYGAGVFLSNDCASSSSPLDSKSAATAAT